MLKRCHSKGIYPREPALSAVEGNLLLPLKVGRFPNLGSGLFLGQGLVS